VPSARPRAIDGVIDYFGDRAAMSARPTVKRAHRRDSERNAVFPDEATRPGLASIWLRRLRRPGLAEPLHVAVAEFGKHAANDGPIEEGGENMKRLSIALLLALVAFSGVGVAWADDLTSLATGINSIQTP
jgi:hypothetical protein